MEDAQKITIDAGCRGVRYARRSDALIVDHHEREGEVKLPISRAIQRAKMLPRRSA